MLDASQQNDTVVAISTPPGVGGIAILRLSGKLSKEAIRSLFDNYNKIKPRYATFGKLSHPSLSSNVFDECIVTYFNAPYSATGEDVVEISIHGGEYLQNKLLTVLANQPGVRLAEAGEFTYRSFLSGKMDLSRAESVADLIHAKDKASHASALKRMQGQLEQKIYSIKKMIFEPLMLIEAELDFSDQEIEFTPLKNHENALERSIRAIDELLESYHYGKRVFDGFRVVFVGKPNTGKSTLFNALLGEERAIVTKVAGTTRDTIESTISLAGHTLLLIDTAGIRETEEEIEQVGVDRSQKEIQRADIVLNIFSYDQKQLEISYPQDTLIINIKTKADLETQTHKKQDVISVSGLTGAGIPQLREEVSNKITRLAQKYKESVLLTNQRQATSFQQCKTSLLTALNAIKNDFGYEYIASDLHVAINALSELTGETTPDDILNDVFKKFCVGK